MPGWHFDTYSWARNTSATLWNCFPMFIGRRTKMKRNYLQLLKITPLVFRSTYNWDRNRTNTIKKYFSGPLTTQKYKGFLEFVDISRPLTSLTKDILFEWIKTHLDTLNVLKKFLTKGLVLKCLNLEKTINIVYQCGKYALACLLTPAYSHVLDVKEKTILHPITDMKGLFRDS